MKAKLTGDTGFLVDFDAHVLDRKKIYVHQITKQDLQAFDTALVEEGNEDLGGATDETDWPTKKP